jgi:hypothetical protein
MLRRTHALALIAVALPLMATDAIAIAQRTFVASYGLSANTAFNCSIAKPCRAFSEAIGVTIPGGEVIVLDSAGYGAMTITRAVSIVAPPGVYAGITAFSGFGVTVDAPGESVRLRGLKINGQGATDGIVLVHGARLLVEDCEISNFPSTGIDLVEANSSVTVKNTLIRESDTGAYSAGILDATFDGVHISGGTVGILATSGSRLTITRSVLSQNSEIGIYATAAGGTTTDVMVTQSTIAESNYGVDAVAFSGSTARIVVDGTAINDVAIRAFNFAAQGGTEIIYTSGTNTVGFNNGISNGPLTLIGQH